MIEPLSVASVVSGTEATPEQTAFVRFRGELVAHKIDRLFFTTMTAQLTSKAVTVKTGVLVDATIIASVSDGDDDARWVKHKGKPAAHRFKADFATNADLALVGDMSVASANINYGRACPDAVPGNRRGVCRQRLSCQSFP